MPNKSLSLLGILLLGVGCVGLSAVAQEKASEIGTEAVVAQAKAAGDTQPVVNLAESPTISLEGVSQEIKNSVQNVASVPVENATETKEDPALSGAEAKTDEVKMPDMPMPSESALPLSGDTKQESVAVPTASPATNEMPKAEAAIVVDEGARKMLEQELNDVSTDDKTAVDFPARKSLGELELAPLPGINEQFIAGPASMEPSVSPRDLPSEQLLGRITTEVFQEMADLERGNIFLKLQTQKEQLKNDLEKLKATYRQARLDEISKREEVVRSRIAWWQEQEKIRLETEKKKQEEAELEQKIAEAEAMREKLRSDALNKAETEESTDEESGTQINVDPTQTTAVFADLYAISSIKGVGGKLSVQLKDLSDDTTLVVRVGDTLPSGHVVRKITKDSVFVIYGEQESSLSMTSPKKSSDEEE